MVLASAGILSYSMYGMMLKLNSLNRDTTKQEIYEAALTSYLNYTRAAIKRRWCFTSNWDQDTPINCTLAHPFSTERLLITTDQLTHINQMIALNPSFPHGTPVQLTGFDVKVDLTQLPETHALRMIAAAHELAFVQKVHFTVTRMTDADLPSNGSSAYLRIQVELLPKDGGSLPENRSMMMGWSKDIIYPREVGTFALIVPHDLRLGQSGGIDGDVTLPGVGGTTSSVPGIKFVSPVYVNGNIYVPGNPSNSYVPVTFAAPVTIGNGILLQGGQPAVTTQAGGYQNQTYSEVSGFGGFLAGITIDGEDDTGLDCYDGQSTCTKPNAQLMMQCMARTAIKTDPTVTTGSALLGWYKGNNAWDLSWATTLLTRFNIIDGNFFRASTSTPNSMSFTGNWATAPQIQNQTSPIMSINVTLPSGQTISNVQMPRDGSLTFSPKISPPSGSGGGGGGGGGGATTQQTPPVITITTASYTDPSTNNMEENRVELAVSEVNPDSVNYKFDVTINGYDTSVQNGATIRTGTNTYSPTMLVHFTSKDGQLQNNTFANTAAWMRTDGNNDLPNSKKLSSIQPDWENFEKVCGFMTNNSLNSFPASTWDVEYSMQTSWNLAPPPNAPLGSTIGAGSVLLTSATDTVANRVSIAALCEIGPSATVVAGFYVCDQFKIDARNQKLQIIGTVITRNLVIDPSAYTAGITWASIYNPTAIVTLQNQGILHPMIDPNTGLYYNNATCAVDPSNPIWNPARTALQAQNIMQCNAISLRTSFNPITWTTVDPDCGLDPTATSPSGTQCKYHPVRFTVMEYDRGFYL